MTNTLKAALLVSSALVATPVFAQSGPLAAPPPQTYSVDERGVDLVSGLPVRQINLVSIGDPEQGGLTYSRAYINRRWRDSVTGTLHSSGNTFSVSIGGVTDVFVRSGSTYTPTRNVGQTLKQSGADHIYTMADGTVAMFSISLSGPAGSWTNLSANQGYMTELRRPNGEITRFIYDTSDSWTEFGSPPQSWIMRLREVTNNRGYALRFTYDYEDYPLGGQGDAWQTLRKVTGYNLANCSALESCSPDTVWPSVTFSPTTGGTMTDQSGRVTHWGSGGELYVTRLRLPQNPNVDVVRYATPNDQVSSVEIGGQTWNYAFASSGATARRHGYGARRRNLSCAH